MKRILLVLGLLVLVGAVGIGLSDDQGSDVTSPPSVGDGNELERDIRPDPEIRATQQCNYLLGNFTPTEAGYRFVADSTLRNTGNITVRALVVASWDLIGGERIVEEKTVKIPVGGSRRVGFVHVATQDEIDQHQALGFDQNCRVRVRLIDTLGEPQDI